MQLCDKILPRKKELSDTEGRLLYRHDAVYMLCCPPERMRNGGRKGEDSERARQRESAKERDTASQTSQNRHRTSRESKKIERTRERLRQRAWEYCKNAL